MSAVPHRRLNILTGDWVLVSPHRMARPWAGAVDPPALEQAPAHDPNCPLCPRVARANGEANPDYRGPFVFQNDFPALLEVSEERADGLLVSAPETGLCRVICYHEDHSLTLAKMNAAQAQDVVSVWIAQTAELGARDDIAAVTIFENRGAMMGASNPHPHGQIWATSSIPNELEREAWHCADNFKHAGAPLLMQYLAQEMALKERIVCANSSFVALVPYWAAWPFETLILPRRHVRWLTDLSPQEAADLADLLRRLAARYDNLFQAPFPYTMGVHQAGFDSGDWEGFTLHLHFYPPLLRSASVRKFMVGFEMLAMPQRDLTPEAAAARLKEQSETHYSVSG
jgi:UDPglucose--hexose-1-phosphate uridylyltransferase